MGKNKMEKQAQVREFIATLTAAYDLTQPLPYELLHTDSARAKKCGDGGSSSTESRKINDFGVGLPPLSRCSS
jgi:hypothetical protein